MERQNIIIVVVVVTVSLQGLLEEYDHPACFSADGGHFDHMVVNWVVALNMA